MEPQGPVFCWCLVLWPQPAVHPISCFKVLQGVHSLAAPSWGYSGQGHPLGGWSVPFCEPSRHVRQARPPEGHPERMAGRRAGCLGTPGETRLPSAVSEATGLPSGGAPACACPAAVDRGCAADACAACMPSPAGRPGLLGPRGGQCMRTEPSMAVWGRRRGDEPVAGPWAEVSPPQPVALGGVLRFKATAPP